MCDIAYVHLIEAVERRALVDRQIIAAYKVAGGAVDEIPNADDERAVFDDALEAAPAPTPHFRSLSLLRELGVA